MHATAAHAHALRTQIYSHALAAGFSKGLLVSAGIAALALIITLITIRVTREDLSGVDPMAAPASRRRRRQAALAGGAAG